ncbi:hypothetical protein BN1723_014535 [Verticillium longisporum]|uniref:Uncharacterized protein n=1 Tax=Verticillium longisporum TaxID=100787 RepID=A0A0G4MBE2_VERLO|nr:hypothetical protein BN1708_015668 [Verticillium longisporum]CRK31612.1 hypothetical protein BN1723_014535 [Verticillium longisporum]
MFVPIPNSKLLGQLPPLFPCAGVAALDAGVASCADESLATPLKAHCLGFLIFFFDYSRTRERNLNLDIARQ